MSNYQTVKLSSGSHSPGSGEGCLMEITSLLAGESWSDTPECACPVLTRFAIRTNDWMNDTERQELWQFTTRLVGSRADKATERARGFRMADWAVREVLPLMMDVRKQTEWAAKFRALDPIVDKKTADVGRKLSHEYRATAITAAAVAADVATYAAAYAAADVAAITAAAADATAITAAAADAYATAITAAAAAADVATYATAITAADVAADVATYATAITATYVATRKTLCQMRVDLLDELLPAAPMPDEALVCEIAEKLDRAKVTV